MEQFPNKAKYESPDGKAITELESVACQLDQCATTLESGDKRVALSEECGERVNKKIKNIKNLLKAASMGIALYGGVKVGDQVKEYATSRYEITTEVGQDGKMEYKHEDPETTRILKFLTGAAELAPEDRIHFYRELVRSKIKMREEAKKFASLGSLHKDTEEQMKLAALNLNEQNKLEDNLPTDELGLRQRLRDLFAADDLIMYGEIQGDIEKRIDEAFADCIKAQVEYNPVLEKMVWTMQKKVGAPRIRWSAPQDNRFAHDAGHVVGAGRSMYTVEDNTIYITPGFNDAALGKYVAAEDAHAFQYNKHPVQSRLRGMIDDVKLVIRTIKENKSSYEAQLAEYDIPGTIEYDAHKIIEPRIIKEAMEDSTAQP